jgi:hypothetical protein
MMPAVHVPGTAEIGVPVEVKLKPRFRYDASAQSFAAGSGKQFYPLNDLPEGSRIVSKAPALADKPAASLSKWERELSRHLQVILPREVSPHDVIETVRKWPAVEDAWIGPEVSLPGGY